MFKDQVVRKTILVATTISIVVALIFTTLIFINWHWLVGWLLGCLVTLFGFLSSVQLLNLSLKKIKTKWASFWIAWARCQIHVLVHVIFFVILIMINTYVSNGKVFKVESTWDAINPINLYTYLAALSIIVISILVVHIFKKRR